MREVFVGRYSGLVTGAGDGDSVDSVADPLPGEAGSGSGRAAAGLGVAVLRALGRERAAAGSDAPGDGSLGPIASVAPGAFTACPDGAVLVGFSSGASAWTPPLVAAVPVAAPAGLRVGV